MTLLFHLVEADAWDAARRSGSLTSSTRGRTLDEEGFIHCSLADQVEAVANVVYPGVHGLLLLTIDADRLRAPLQFDPAPSGEEFPHIYGPLNVDAVVAVQPFEPGPDGRFRYP